MSSKGMSNTMAKTQLPEEICILLKRVSNQFNRFQEQGYPAGILGAGYMLSILAGRSEISQRELASMMQVRPASVSEMLGKLEESGLIRRRINPADRRNSMVSLTVKGRRTEEDAKEKRQRFSEELLSPLTPEEQLQLRDLLKKLFLGFVSNERFTSKVKEGQTSE